MMDDDFRVFDLGKFYIQFVRRAYDEFLVTPIDPFRAKVAATHADIMAERVWKFYENGDRSKVGNAESARKYREYLAQKECPDFQLVWDVHDGHKHVEISRSNRQVSSAAQTGVVTHEGAFDPEVFGAEAFDVDHDEIVVRLDNGKERLIAEILKNVIEMWERLLKNF